MKSLLQRWFLINWTCSNAASSSAIIQNMTKVTRNIQFILPIASVSFWRKLLILEKTEDSFIYQSSHYFSVFDSVFENIYFYIISVFTYYHKLPSFQRKYLFLYQHACLIFTLIFDRKNKMKFVFDIFIYFTILNIECHKIQREREENRKQWLYFQLLLSASLCLAGRDWRWWWGNCSLWSQTRPVVVSTAGKIGQSFFGAQGAQ